MVLLTVTSGLRNPPLLSLKFNHLDKKNAKSFKETRAPVWRSQHREDSKPVRSQQDVRSPANYMWSIHSPAASPALPQFTEPGETKNRREGTGRGERSGQLVLSSATAVCISSGNSLKAHFPFLSLFYCLHLPPGFRANQITDSSFHHQLQGFSPPATWLIIHEKPPVTLENRTL